jgi:transcriptional regulator with XRE-family HTH domain
VPHKIKRACLFPQLPELEITEYLLYLSSTDKSIKSSQMKQSFGEYIRQLRTKHGFTLTQLGAKLDLDSANLSKIENGKRDFDEKRLTLLAQVFDLDLEELKTEFFGEQFALKIYENKCSIKTLKVAEQKLNYLKIKNAKQLKIDIL